MTSTQDKTLLSFSNGILMLKFREGAVVEAEDVIYIYCYAIEQSGGKPFGILFDTFSKHELTEEAIQHIAQSNYLDKIIAIAYISKDLISKIRLNLLLIFERPKIKPKLFSNEEEGLKWLEVQVKENVSF